MEDEYEYATPDMGSVTIRVHAVDQITIWNAQGQQIGNLDLREIGEDDGSSTFLVTNMYVEGPDGTGVFKGQGIMTYVIRLLAEDYGITLFARYPDGQTQEDGSHLTQDAPGFIRKMVQAGFVRWFAMPRDADRE